MATLDELGQTLPNGFHDAEIKALSVDFGTRQVTMELSVWVGDMDDEVAPKEAYRDGQLVTEGLEFIVMEPPDPKYPYSKVDRLWVDLADGPSGSQVPAASQLPTECFSSGLFVRDWNSFIYLAARSARLEWRGGMYDRGDRKP
jgi:hypothetical protein